MKTPKSTNHQFSFLWKPTGTIDQTMTTVTTQLERIELRLKQDNWRHASIDQEARTQEIRLHNARLVDEGEDEAPNMAVGNRNILIQPRNARKKNYCIRD